MKKILIGIMLLSLTLLTGCGVYGTGDTYGYITTVEDGIFWSKVWVRAELESSNTDCYAIKSTLKSELRQLADSKTRVKLNFDKHLAMLTADCRQAEVTGWEVATK